MTIFDNVMFGNITLSDLAELVAFTVDGSESAGARSSSDIDTKITVLCPELDAGERTELHRLLLELRFHRPIDIGHGVQLAIHERAPIQARRAG